MAKRRTFTPEFKAELVLEVLSGATSQAEVCRRHNLNENQLSQWKQQLVCTTMPSWTFLLFIHSFFP